MLVDRARGDEAVRDDFTRLPHPADARDGLAFGRGLELRLHEDDDLSRLEIDTDAPSLDLQDDEAEARAGGETVDDRLPLLDGEVAVDAIVVAGDEADVIQHLPKEGEEHDLAPFLPVMAEEVAETVVLGGLLTPGADGRREPLLHEVHRGFRVGLAIRRLERDDFVDLLEVGQLLKHVLLGAAQVHGGELQADFDGFRARLSQQAAKGLLKPGLHREDEVLQFLQSVLQRRAGEESDEFGGGRQPRDGLTALGLGVLHRMRLVDRDEIDGPDPVDQLAEGREGRDGDPALPPPLIQFIVPVEAVDDDGPEFRVLADLTLPVDEYRVRGHDEEAALPLGGEVAHGREHLHGLAEPHVIPEQGAPLVNQILRAEQLVTTERRREEGQVELRGLDRVGDLSRETAALIRGGDGSDRRTGRPRTRSFDEYDEARGILAVAAPDFGLVDHQVARVAIQQAGFGQQPGGLGPESRLVRSMGRALGRGEEMLAGHGAVAEQGHLPTEGLTSTLDPFGAGGKFAQQDLVTSRREQQRRVARASLIRIRHDPYRGPRFIEEGLRSGNRRGRGDFADAFACHQGGQALATQFRHGAKPGDLERPDPGAEIRQSVNRGRGGHGRHGRLDEGVPGGDEGGLRGRDHPRDLRGLEFRGLRLTEERTATDLGLVGRGKRGEVTGERAEHGLTRRSGRRA